MTYFSFLALMYGLAAFVLLRNKRMSIGIIMMLAAPLACASILYIFAMFIDVPHVSFIIAQSAFLISIIVISVFERRDMKR